jgi:hypothetical protein
VNGQAELRERRIEEVREVARGDALQNREKLCQSHWDARGHIMTRKPEADRTLGQADSFATSAGSSRIVKK